MQRLLLPALLLALPAPLARAQSCPVGSAPFPVRPGPTKSGPAAGVPAPGRPGSPGGFANPFAPTSPFGLGTSECGLADAPATDWSAWWSLHEDLYLALRASAGNAPVSGESAAPAAGSGPPRDVTPLLGSLLRGERDDALVRAGMLAVARAARESSAPARAEQREALVRYLADRSQEQSETAALALGVLGDTAAAPRLAELVHDTRAGQRLVGRGEVALRTRAFAAYALALTGARAGNEDVARFAYHHLTRALDEDTSAERDLEVACVLGIGLLPLADDGGTRLAAAEAGAPSRVGELRLLLDLVASPFQDRLVRAHAATALARLLDGLPPARRDALASEIAPALIAALRSSDARRGARAEALEQSLVLALGLLGDDDEGDVDASIRKTLADPRALSDPGARRFALVSLAQVAARAGTDGSSARPRAEVERALLLALASEDAETRPWAALAVGLFGHGLAARGSAPSEALASSLRAALTEAASPSEASAACLALGLVRDPRALPLLRERLAERGQVSGYAALGLGLLGARELLPAVRTALAREGNEPELAERLALAAWLLDPGTTPGWLAARVESTRDADERAALLLALGRIGDARGLAALEHAASATRSGAPTRAAAVAALGRLAEREEPSCATLLGARTNYLAAPGTLRGAAFALDPR